MHSIKDVLPGVLRSTNTRSEAIERIQTAWPRLVGDVLARHSTPVTIRRRTVVVQTDDSGTSFALSLRKPQVLGALSGIAGCEIADWILRAGTVQ